MFTARQNLSGLKQVRHTRYMIPRRLFSSKMPFPILRDNRDHQSNDTFYLPNALIQNYEGNNCYLCRRQCNISFRKGHADSQKTNRIYRPCKRGMHFAGSFRPHTPRPDTLFLGYIFRLVPYAALFFPIGYFFQKIQRHTIIRHKENQQSHHSTPFLLRVCLLVRRRIMGHLSFVGIRYVDLRTIFVVAFLGNHSLGNDLSQPAVMVSYRPFRSKYLLLRSASVRQVMATRLRRMGHRNRRLAGSKIGYRTSLLFRNGIYIVTVFSCRYVAQTQRTTSLFLPRQISLCLDFAFGRGRMATGRTHTIA